MKLEKLTILARASLNYQVSEVSLEVSEFTKEDITKVESLVISESVKMVRKEAELVGANNAQNQKPEVQVTREYKPAQQFNHQNKGPKMASDSQIGFLKKLGYQYDTTGMTSYQASQLIEQLKGGHQYANY